MSGSKRGSMTGQVAIVTGASMGLGRALSLELARRGAEVVLTARSRLALIDVAREVEAVGGTARVEPGDVTRKADLSRVVAAAIEDFGRVDVMVNNAGYGLTSFVEDIPEDELDGIWAVNVKGVLFGVQAVLPQMKAQGDGVIVNMGSVVGRRSVPAYGAYCMSKFAVAALSESLRAEVRRFGVHVLQAEPGLTETRFAENRHIVGEHPRRAPGTPMKADVAARRIATAIERRKDRVSLGASGRAMILMNKLAPGLVNRMFERHVARTYRDSDSGDSASGAS